MLPVPLLRIAVAVVSCLLAQSSCAAALNTTTMTASEPQDLFVSGISNHSWSKGRTVCYRIPSLLRLRSGILLAFATERLGDCSDSADTNIVFRRSLTNGTTWEAMSLFLSTGPDHAEMETVWSLQDKATGKIFVFSNTNAHAGSGCNCEVFYVTSEDDGQTWSGRTVLSADGPIYGMSLASGITHSSGRLVGCMRKICRNSCPANYHAKSFFSDDHGATWNASEWLPSGTTECQLAELSDGKLYMNMRPLGFNTSLKNARLVAFSTDMGTTWSKVAADPALVDYGGGDEGSTVSDPANKKIYFVHPDSHSRDHLALYRSEDDAASWEHVSVYVGGAAYSDSAILDPTPGLANAVGILYERDGYKTVAFLTAVYPEQGAKLIVTDSHPNGFGAAGQYFGFDDAAAGHLFGDPSAWSGGKFTASANGRTGTIIVWHDNADCKMSCGRWEPTDAAKPGDWKVGDAIVLSSLGAQIEFV